MKKIAKNIIGCLAVVLLTISILGYMADLMERKASDIKYKDFFEQKENFDVLFMGTSHVINAIFPMELWNDYGIVSYNFGGHGNQMATTYWVMENALDYTDPQLMVIDCYLLSSNLKGSDKFSYMHLSLDTFPLSFTKIRSVLDLLDDPAMDERIENGTARISDEPRTKMELLWDYSVYHTRWNELTQADFEPAWSKEKGAESRINVVQGTLNKIDSGSKSKGGTVGEEYLCKMIESCQSRGIEVLLVYLPFPAGETQQKDANYVYDIAETYGVDYINFLDLDVIDYRTDMYDEASHLNPSGARKVTRYLGEYITNNYDIVNQRENPSYSFWNEDYNEYAELKDIILKSQNSLMNYLMLLSGDQLNAMLDVRNKDIFKNETYLNLLANLGVNMSELGEDTDFIVIQNGGESAIVLNNFRENGSAVDTEIGNISIMYDIDGAYHDGELGHYSLYINGEEAFNGNTRDDFCMRCSVKRINTGEIIDSVNFIYSVDSKTGDVILDE